MRRLGERGRFLGLGGVTWPDWAGGWYSSSPESSEAPSRALEIVTAAALAVFRRGRGKTGWRCCGMVMDAILYEFKVKWGSFGPLLNRLKLQILDDDFNKSLSLDNTTAVTTPVAYNSVFIGFRRGSRSSAVRFGSTVLPMQAVQKLSLCYADGRGECWLFQFSMQTYHKREVPIKILALCKSAASL